MLTGATSSSICSMAAAYNLAAVIKDSTSWEGILYFFGTFGPVFLFWGNKTAYDSRVSVDDDPAHRTLEVLQLCFLATAVLHIRPVSMMSDPYLNSDMFAFSLGMLLGALGNVVRYIEVAIWGEGGPQMKTLGKIYAGIGAFPALFFLAATIISGLCHFHPIRGFYGSEHRWLAEPNYKDDSDYPTDGSNTTHIPILLCLCGWLCDTFVGFLIKFTLLSDRDSIRKYVPPMNVEFVIHRYGEWVMLMLGESVLSLLIVAVSEGTGYYLSLYAGILSVIALQYLHYRSQPHEADGHAMRRNANAGMIFVIAMQIYSAMLILLGAAYKMLLTEFTYEAKPDPRQLLRMLQTLPQHDVMRYLAGEDGVAKLGDVDRQQRNANLFCLSMAAVFVCLDVVTVVHKGFTKNISRCKCWRGKMLTFLNVALVAFIATVPLYFTNPDYLALIGLGCVCIQIWIRSSGASVFFEDETDVNESGHVKNEDKDEEKWPNVTEPRSHHSAHMAD